MEEITHWECDKSVLSSALAEGDGGVGACTERDEVTGAAWVAILVGSCSLTEGIKEDEIGVFRDMS